MLNKWKKGNLKVFQTDLIHGYRSKYPISSSQINCLKLVLLFASFYGYFRIFQNACIDDAYITLDYVRSIVGHGVWGITPAHVTNTATSPLNVILLSLLGLVNKNFTRLPVILASISFVVIFQCMDRIAVRLPGGQIFGWLTTYLLLLNPLLLSTLGMESILFSSLIIASLYCLVYQKWNWLAVVLGLLVLTRMDGILLACILFFKIPFRKNRLKFICLILLVTLPWFLFSWVQLGSFIPDTFFIKTLQSHWGHYEFSDGISLYFERYPFESFLSFFILLSCIAMIFRPIRTAEVPGVVFLYGLSHFAAYSFLHVPPYHWYYAPEIVSATIVGSFALGILYENVATYKWKTIVVRGFISVLILIPAVGLTVILANQQFKMAEMPIHTNRASQEQYKQIGIWIKDNCADENLRLNGEIGTLSYYCDCTLMDWFGERGWLVSIVNEQKKADGPVAALFRFNFRFLKDDSRSSSYSHQITAYIDRKTATDPFIRRWETTTRWTPNSLVTLSD